MSSLCQAFIFDFNTIFKENHGFALKHLDKFKLFKYTARGRNPVELLKKLDEFLISLQGRGIKRAVIIENWLKGEKTSHETLEFIQGRLMINLQKNPSSTTTFLLNEIVKMIFKPQSLSTIFQVNKFAITVVDKLLRDNRQVYLVGNIDEETMNILKESHSNILSKFKDCLFSYECGFIKPEKNFMEKMKRKWNHSPIKTCIIDDDLSDINFLSSMGYNVFDVNTINKLH